jgi:Protein of unknown function (DUF3455)
MPMINRLRTGAAAFALVAPIAVATSAAELPDTIATEGATILVQLHAEGAQIYECKSDEGKKLTWQFREPIATLFLNGVTVGRHYAGPTWEVGGGAVVGKVVGDAPGTGPKDIPWLKLDVSDRRGGGPLKDATTVQRINTAGGNMHGKCGKVGAFRVQPYSADYVFLRKEP